MFVFLQIFLPFKVVCISYLIAKDLLIYRFGSHRRWCCMLIYSADAGVQQYWLR